MTVGRLRDDGRLAWSRLGLIVACRRTRCSSTAVIARLSVTSFAFVFLLESASLVRA
jgi:hypothetical protein